MKNIQKSLPIHIACERQRWTSCIHSSSKTFISISLTMFIESNKLLIPGGPWAVAIDKVSDSSFPPRIEAEWLLSEVTCCERWENFMHLARWFCIFVAFFTYYLPQYLQMYTAFPSTLAAVRCLHTSDSFRGIFL